MTSALTLLYPDGYQVREVPKVGHCEVDRYDAVNAAAVPLSGGISTGASLIVSGWTFDALRGLPAAGVLLVFGDNVVEAAYGEPTPEVAERFANPRLNRSGFRGIIAPPVTASGVVRIAAYAVSADGAELVQVPGGSEVPVVHGDVPVSFNGTRRPGLAKWTIDAFSSANRTLDGATITVQRGSDLTVRGWAIDRERALPVAGVFMVVDDRDVVRGYVGAARRDVAAALQLESVIASGFEIQVPTAALSPGSHRLQLGTVGATGADYDLADISRSLRVISALRR